MLESILAAVIPVLATAGLVFAWVRSGQKFDHAIFTPLVVNLGTPCLIFATFAKTRVSPADFGAVAMATVAGLAVVSIAAVPVLLRFPMF